MLPEFPRRAVEKEGAVIKIVLQNRHHKHKALEIGKCQHCFETKVPVLTRRSLGTLGGTVNVEEPAVLGWGFSCLDCVLDNGAFAQELAHSP